ncbi:matrixin family metalloprotease [Streptomyces sp. NPDC001858]
MAQAAFIAFPEVAKLPTVDVGEKADGLEAVQGYLSRFGYLPDSRTTSMVDMATSSALKKYQEFNGIPATGAFDERTRTLMTQSRCGMADLRDGVEFATTCGWTRRILTFAFDTGTGDVAGNQEFDAVRGAFRSWAGPAGFTFNEVAPNQNPDILVGWRPASDPDHSMVGGILAHADFPPGCGVVTNGSLPKPVHFDDTEHMWSIGAAVGAFDVETVALHELGHILGLGHSSVAGAVMAPSVGPNSTKTTLTQDDIDGVRNLYAPSAWSGWESLGGVITSNIATSVNADGRMEFFARGTDGAVWHQWQTAPSNGWSGWESLGGVITSDIATCVNSDGRMEFFARGTDNAVWHQWQTAPSNGWSGWESLGGVITSNIATCVNADGRMEFFARGTDGAVWHQWQTAPSNGWSGWESLGGVITSDIATCVNSDGRMEFFARGTDNAVWHQWQTAPSNGWSGWESLGGVITSNIATCVNADGRMEFFARGTDGAVWHQWQTAPSNGWSGWESLGGVITSDIAVSRNRDGRMEFFARGTDGAVWHQWQTAPSNGWSGWESLGGVITSNIAVNLNSDGRMEFFARGTDNAVWHQWRTQA